MLGLGNFVERRRGEGAAKLEGRDHWNCFASGSALYKLSSAAQLGNREGLRLVILTKSLITLRLTCLYRHVFRLRVAAIVEVSSL